MRKLELNRSYNYPLTLPCGLTEISFSWESEYNYPLVLPESIKVAVFGIAFNQPLALGPDIEVLKLGGSSFDKPIDLSVAQKLRVVTFGHSFNSPVDFPASIEAIEFGYDFNQHVDLPPNLRKITFGMMFACPILIPPRLEELLFELEGVFNSPLVFPEDSCMKRLKLSNAFRQPIDLSVVQRLEAITFGHSFNSPLHLLPASVEEIEFGYCFNQHVDFPTNVRKITFGEQFACPILIPPRLEELLFHWEGVFNSELVFPENSCTKVLKLSNAFEHAINLPEGLESVYVGDSFNVPLTLPSTLKSLYFGCDSVLTTSLFNQHIDLPSGIKSVGFGEHMQHHVTFPVGLESLTWCSNFPVDLPDGLKWAYFGPFFQQPLTLPSSLEHISFLDGGIYNLPLILPQGCSCSKLEG